MRLSALTRTPRVATVGDRDGGGRGGVVARVFVSHAGEDAALAGEVHRWLVEDGHEVFLDRDLRDGLVVGEEWEQRLHERLRWADAVVCLLPSARGSRLLPVRAEPGVHHPLLKALQRADAATDLRGAREKLAEAAMGPPP